MGRKKKNRSKSEDDFEQYAPVEDPEEIEPEMVWSESYQTYIPKQYVLEDDDELVEVECVPKKEEIERSNLPLALSLSTPETDIKVFREQQAKLNPQSVPVDTGSTASLVSQYITPQLTMNQSKSSQISAEIIKPKEIIQTESLARKRRLKRFKEQKLKMQNKRNKKSDSKSLTNNVFSTTLNAPTVKKSNRSRRLAMISSLRLKIEHSMCSEIEKLARSVASGIISFDNAVKAKEISDPRFSSLWDKKSPEYTLYSVCHEAGLEVQSVILGNPNPKPSSKVGLSNPRKTVSNIKHIEIRNLVKSTSKKSMYRLKKSHKRNDKVISVSDSLKAAILAAKAINC